MIIIKSKQIIQYKLWLNSLENYCTENYYTKV